MPSGPVPPFAERMVLTPSRTAQRIVQKKGEGKMSVQEQNRTNQNLRRWTARRKAALVLDRVKASPAVAQTARTYDLTPAEIKEWGSVRPPLSPG